MWFIASVEVVFLGAASVQGSEIHLGLIVVLCGFGWKQSLILKYDVIGL